MEKKFKNPMIVNGPKSLIKAFMEELDNLGYKATNGDLCIKNRSLITGFNNTVNLNNNVYDSVCTPLDWAKCPNGQFRLIFELPKQWDEALEKAAEVEKPDWEKGDYFKYNNTIYKISSITDANVFVDNYNLEWTSLTAHNICKKSIKLTPKEIEFHLLSTTSFKIRDRIKYKHSYLNIAHLELFTPDRKAKSISPAIEEYSKKEKYFLMCITKQGNIVPLDECTLANEPDIKLAGYHIQFFEKHVKFGCANITIIDIATWYNYLSVLCIETNVTIEGIKLSKEGNNDILTLQNMSDIIDYYNTKDL